MGEREVPLQLTDRERDQMHACEAYAQQFAASGLPGHGLFMLVAKMSVLLEDAVSRFGYAPDRSPPIRVQKVVWSEADNCWRDLETGVRVEI